MDKNTCDNCIHNDAGICHNIQSKKFGKDISGDEEKCNYYEGLKNEKLD